MNVINTSNYSASSDDLATDLAVCVWRSVRMPGRRVPARPPAASRLSQRASAGG